MNEKSEDETKAIARIAPLWPGQDARTKYNEEIKALRKIVAEGREIYDAGDGRWMPGPKPGQPELFRRRYWQSLPSEPKLASWQRFKRWIQRRFRWKPREMTDEENALKEFERPTDSKEQDDG